MKKAGTFMGILTVLALGGVGAAAQGTSPATGQTVSPVPYILLGVSVVLLAAIVALSYFSKKKK